MSSEISIDIVRKVLVRSVVNEKLRQLLLSDVQGNLVNLEKDFGRFQKHREDYVAQCRERDVKPDYDILKRMAIEEEKFRNQKGQLDARHQEISSLKDGEEFVHGTVDSMVKVGVGSNWHALMTGLEVVLEDGMVKEIRQREIKV